MPKRPQGLSAHYRQRQRRPFAIGAARRTGQSEGVPAAPGGEQDPFCCLPTSEHRLTASSLAPPRGRAQRVQGSGIPSPLRGAQGTGGRDQERCGDFWALPASPTWSRVSRVPREQPLGRRPAPRANRSALAPHLPSLSPGGRGRLEPPPQPDLWPHGERHTPPRPSRSPPAAAIARNFLLPTGGGGPKRASPRPSHPPDRSQQPERFQCPDPKAEETPRRAAGEPVLLLAREARAPIVSEPPFRWAQCPPAGEARHPSAHTAGSDVSLLAHAGPPSHLRRVHPHPARVARRGPRFLPPRGGAVSPPPPPGPPPPAPDAQRETPSSGSGRAGALVPARARAPSPGNGRARPPISCPRCHGTSSPFLRTRGPTPQATRAPLPRRTVSALSCARAARRDPALLECTGPPGTRSANPTCCPQAQHEPPAVLRCAGPTLAREREARASPSHSCSRGAAQAPRFQRARRQHPCFLCQRTIPPRGTPCASAPFLTTQRSASPPFWR